MASVDGGLVVAHVVAMLRGVMSCPVGHGQLPTAEDDYEASLERFDPGALIVEQFPGGDTSMTPGYRDQPNAMIVVVVKLTGVGSQADQAEAIAMLASKALTDKGETEPGFVHPLVVPGHTVHRRVWAGVTPTDTAGASFNSGVLCRLTVSAD